MSSQFPASVGTDIPIPYAIKSAQSVTDGNYDKAILDNLAIIAARLAPGPQQKKVVVELAAGGSMSVDLDYGQVSSIVATVTDGNVNVFFGENSTTFDLQFATGGPYQVQFPFLQYDKFTFVNPSDTDPCFAVIWLLRY